MNFTLPRILAQLGLAYAVKDDVLIISSPKGVDREKKETAGLAADRLRHAAQHEPDGTTGDLS